ncbi:MAG TPA: hypothetical protein ENL34_10875, partial [Chloroflexi bacterium]|nr:hypothetical protein [Chloroflexota bacterium]
MRCKNFGGFGGIGCTKCHELPPDRDSRILDEIRERVERLGQRRFEQGHYSAAADCSSLLKILDEYKEQRKDLRDNT